MRDNDLGLNGGCGEALGTFYDEDLRLLQHQFLKRIAAPFGLVFSKASQTLVKLTFGVK